MSRSIADIPFKLSRIKAIFVGASKSGKSIASISFPKPLHIFDLDGRIRSIRNFYNPNLENLKGVTYDSFNNYLDFGTAFDRLERFCPYETVVIDSLSSLADMIIRFSLREKGLSPLVTSKDYVSGAKRLANIPIPAYDEYNLEASILREVMNMCASSLKCNVILTAHLYHTEEQKKDDSGKLVPVTKYHILTGGKKAAAFLPQKFDEIYHFASDGGSKCVYTQPTDAVDFAGSTLSLTKKLWLKIDPKKPLSAYNGGLYQMIEKECKDSGLLP